MKKTKVLLILMSVFLCLAAAQNLWAATTVTVEGTVTEIATRPNRITIDGNGGLTDVYGIPVNYLKNQHDMVIEVGTYIIVEAYEVTHPQAGTFLVASSVTVDGVTVSVKTGGSVEGPVVEIGTRPNKLVIDANGELTDVYGVRLDYLKNQYNIDIEVGTYVSIEAYVVNTPRFGTKLVAYQITVDDVTVQLRPTP